MFSEEKGGKNNAVSPKKKHQKAFLSEEIMDSNVLPI